MKWQGSNGYAGRNGNRATQVHHRAASAGEVAAWSADRSRHRLRRLNRMLDCARPKYISGKAATA
uniref:Uncharacterized protein n=1 Tax=Rhizobium leguminosarum bv. viciae TaxID=387 RepID=A0A0U2ZM80_RHILV|nr:hypothetical protein [Rhizobium leguminosarum bv. viciae]